MRYRCRSSNFPSAHRLYANGFPLALKRQRERNSAPPQRDMAAFVTYRKEREIGERVLDLRRPRDACYLVSTFSSTKKAGNALVA